MPKGVLVLLTLQLPLILALGASTTQVSTPALIGSSAGMAPRPTTGFEARLDSLDPFSQRVLPQTSQENSLGVDPELRRHIKIITTTYLLTGYCGAAIYPRCSTALDPNACPAVQPARGVLTDECGKYSAWSICYVGSNMGKCLLH